MTEDDAVRRGATAMVFQLHASRRSWTVTGVLIGLGIIGALFFRSFWPIVAAPIAAILARQFIFSSCYRYVERNLGVAREFQESKVLVYKRDPEFKALVDRMYEDSRR